MATYFSSEESERRAWEIAKAHCLTAQRLLRGTETWSLSSLKGTAKAYGGSYSRARDNFLRRLRAAGLQPVTLYQRPHNKRIVII